ncbi:flagellar hook-length control protein FliK [Natroniella sulfidigena]|uniref:flagellar hook-length control protein FliK n=1 Tax=Natroniella sulfidigena TaxID=723921 RepID=UPI00200AAD6B|nr:flagellar hook-length control protein FliK [Natroniella sulfidigena]MCK8816528.1 flagellar hook-length control protein FliK [Natroniella sulfidigena]
MPMNLLDVISSGNYQPQTRQAQSSTANRDDFLSALQDNSDRLSNQKAEANKQSEFKVNDDTKPVENKSSNKQSESKVDDDKKLERLEELLAGNVEEISEEELEEILALLSDLTQLFKSELLNNLEIEELAVEEEQVQEILKQLEAELDGQSLQELEQLMGDDNKRLLDLIKQLELVQEKLAEQQQGAKEGELLKLSEQEQEEMLKLKELAAQMDGEVLVTEKSTEEELLFAQDMLQQASLAQASKEVQEGRRSKNDGTMPLDSEGQLDMELLEQFAGDEEALDELLQDGSSDLNFSEQEMQEFDLTDLNNLLANNQQVEGKQQVNNVDFGQQLNLENILGQISEELKLLGANKNQNQVTIQLQPESLGRLNLRIGLNDGVVSARILSENGEVKELLENNLAKLRSVLLQRDLEVGQIDILSAQAGENYAGSFAEQEEDGSLFNQQQEQESKRDFSLDMEELTVEEILEDMEEQTNVELDGVDYVV